MSILDFALTLVNIAATLGNMVGIVSSLNDVKHMLFGEAVDAQDLTRALEALTVSAEKVAAAYRYHADVERSGLAAVMGLAQSINRLADAIQEAVALARDLADHMEQHYGADVTRIRALLPAVYIQPLQDRNERQS